MKHVYTLCIAIVMIVLTLLALGVDVNVLQFLVLVAFYFACLELVLRIAKLDYNY